MLWRSLRSSARDPHHSEGSLDEESTMVTTRLDEKLARIRKNPQGAAEKAPRA